MLWWWTRWTTCLPKQNRAVQCRSCWMSHPPQQTHTSLLQRIRDAVQRWKGSLAWVPVVCAPGPSTFWPNLTSVIHYNRIVDMQNTNANDECATCHAPLSQKTLLKCHGPYDDLFAVYSRVSLFAHTRAVHFVSILSRFNVERGRPCVRSRRLKWSSHIRSDTFFSRSWKFIAYSYAQC